MIASVPLPELLKNHFGHDRFRPLQREIVEATLAGRDTLAILPTGAGKSLCYQLPALARDGLTLVVSPLIALMKDQVDQLTASGIPATFLNSTLSPEETRGRLTAIRDGEIKLVYLAPERLLGGDFLAAVTRWPVTALAIDEAHCISEWGHDFRPEYRRLRELRTALPGIPTIALTATATPRVREDIVGQLGLREAAVFLASFNRPNLHYLVEPKRDALARIVGFLRARDRESGIIYCQSRRRSEELAAGLRHAGIPALCYHAGLEAETRARHQEAFIRDETRVICATIAFGMGIDKPDVRFVIHADLPKNLEGYYQETGRAGRDGLPADCLLLYSRGDVAKLFGFLDDIQDNDARDHARAQIDRMTDFAEDDACRRVALLGHFGETWNEENCGACDHCLTPREPYDATLDAQKLVSCVLRVKQAGGRPIGLRQLAEILTGSSARKILAAGYDKLSTYGIGRDRSREDWANLARKLIRMGWLASDGGRYPTIAVTHAGMTALRERRALTLSRPQASARAIASRRAGDIDCDPGLLEELRAHRKRTADAAEVPPYVVFSDVSLRHMARDYPTDDDAFLRIPGVGRRKLGDHGPGFLGLIARWLGANPRRQFTPLRDTPDPTPAIVKPTSLASLEKFRAGLGIDEIARERGLAASTIQTHLANAIEGGEAVDDADLRRLYSEREEQRMRAAFEGHDEVALRPVFDKLGGEIDYGKLRIFRAAETRHAPRQT